MTVFIYLFTLKKLSKLAVIKPGAEGVPSARALWHARSDVAESVKHASLLVAFSRPGHAQTSELANRG